MYKEDVVIIGASGFAKEVLWLLEENNKKSARWNILGFVDRVDSENTDRELGYHIYDDEWLMSYENPINVVCGIGNSMLRKKIIKKLENKKNIIFPNIVSVGAVLSDSVRMGKGCVICSNSILTVDIKIGDFVTVNLDCTVGHDAVLNDYVTLNPSTNVSGNVIVDSGTEIGTGVNIIQGISIGKNSIIGAGAVVIRNLPDSCTAVGNPAKVIKIRDES